MDNDAGIEQVEQRVGRWRQLVRWAVSHPEVCAGLTLLAFLAFCGCLGWRAYHPSHPAPDWNQDHSAVENRIDQLSVRFAPVLAWLFLSTVIVRGKMETMKWSGWAGRSFDGRERQRILDGVPIRGSVLACFALFGLVGLSLGLVLIAEGISLRPWLASIPSRLREQSLSALVMGVVAVYSAARLLWRVLIQTEWDYLFGTHRAEMLEELLQSEQALREEELEEKKTAVRGWPWLVLAVGFAGLMWLASRLPDAEETLCLLSGFAGFLTAAAMVYISQTKPRLSRLYLTLVVILFFAALVYCWVVLKIVTLRPLIIGLGLGIATGSTFVFLHLNRKQNSGPPSDEGRNER